MKFLLVLFLMVPLTAFGGESSGAGLGKAKEIAIPRTEFNNIAMSSIIKKDQLFKLSGRVLKAEEINLREKLLIMSDEDDGSEVVVRELETSEP
jgi:hypothetical protein